MEAFARFGSEDQLETELDLAFWHRGRSKNLRRRCISGCREDGCVGAAWDLEHGMVKQIEEFCSELRVESLVDLVDGRVLHQREIDGVDPGTNDGVALLVAKGGIVGGGGSGRSAGGGGSCDPVDAVRIREARAVQVVDLVCEVYRIVLASGRAVNAVGVIEDAGRLQAKCVTGNQRGKGQTSGRTADASNLPPISDVM